MGLHREVRRGRELCEGEDMKSVIESLERWAEKE